MDRQLTTRVCSSHSYVIASVKASQEVRSSSQNCKAITTLHWHAGTHVSTKKPRKALQTPSPRICAESTNDMTFHLSEQLRLACSDV